MVAYLMDVVKIDIVKNNSRQILKSVVSSKQQILDKILLFNIFCLATLFCLATTSDMRMFKLTQRYKQLRIFRCMLRRLLVYCTLCKILPANHYLWYTFVFGLLQI